jgi:hypothetical protein
LDQRDEPLSASGEAPAHPKSRRRLLIGAAVLLVVAVMLVLPGISTLQPQYYERYPDVREAVALWETSTHSRMSCGSCHIEPGFVAHVAFGFKSVPAFYSQLIQGPSETNLLGAPPSEACLRCHTLSRAVSADGDVRIPHRAHIEILGVECVACHLELVHYESPLGLNRPPMTMCMEQCHDGERAGQECDKCHTRKNVPDDHRQPQWLEVHREESEKQDCGGCHAWTPDFCDECHKDRPRSHEGNWKKLHAPRATEKSDGCSFCHDDQFCLDCH